MTSTVAAVVLVLTTMQPQWLFKVDFVDPRSGEIVEAVSRVQRVSKNGTQSEVFSFFAETNWEVLVTALPWCETGGWFFKAGAASSLEYQVTVVDPRTGLVVFAVTQSAGPGRLPVLEPEAWPCGSTRNHFKRTVHDG